MQKILPPFGLLFYCYASLTLSELLLRFVAWDTPLGDGLPFVLGFLLPAAMALWLLGSLLPRRGGRIVTVSLLCLTALFYCSQMIYYEIFHTFYVAYSVLHSAQVLQFWRMALSAILDHWIPFLLFWVPPIVYAKFGRRFGFARIRLADTGAVVIAILSAYMLCVTVLPLGGTSSMTAYDLYNNTRYMDASVKQFGLGQAFFMDVRRLLFGFTPHDSGYHHTEAAALMRPDRSSSKEEDSASKPESGTASDAASSKPESPGSSLQTGTNAMDLDFAALAAAEKDPEIADMHRYFAEVEPTNRNEMTGRFAGDNLILITAEAFSPYAVDPKLTPTLYKLVHEGMYFSNYYTPGWGVSTSDGEYVSLQGLIPMSGVWSMYRSSRNELPFTMGNQLSKLGYASRAYHNNTFDYYGRDESHPNLGFAYKALGNGLDVKRTWPESDLEMVDITTGEYMKGEPFVTYYMTVSGHMLYTWGDNYIANKNRALVEDLPWSDGCKAYLACNIELDRALELLLKRLEEAGIAERTVIAMTADHYPYGLTQAEIEEMAGHPVDENFEIYRNNLILYQKGMEPMTIDRPASSLDLLPTLSNLFGLEYDSRLLMGRDLFSDADPLVIFANRSWISADGRYNALTNAFTPAEGATENKNQIRSIRETVNNRFSISAKMLEKDYFAKALGIVNTRPPMEIWNESSGKDPEGPPSSVVAVPDAAS